MVCVDKNARLHSSKMLFTQTGGRLDFGPQEVICPDLENCLEHSAVKVLPSVSYPCVCVSSRALMSMHAYVYMHICVGSMCLNKCKCVYVPNLFSPVKTKQLAVPANISRQLPQAFLLLFWGEREAS